MTTASETPGAVSRATTPRAAAVAGIAFAVLFALGVVFVRLGSDALASGDYSPHAQSQLGIAMALMPFAGIAFLWFLGVVRNHLGSSEDRFFGTVILGSGLLFVAMSFVAFAVAAAMMSAHEAGAADAASYSLARGIINQTFNIYAVKMAGLFMSSLSSLWQKTRVMPRSLALGTYALSIVMLVSVSHNLWLTLLFPMWVLVISIFILVTGLRRETTQ